jgi:hypothetical protein
MHTIQVQYGPQAKSPASTQPRFETDIPDLVFYLRWYLVNKRKYLYNLLH